MRILLTAGCLLVAFIQKGFAQPFSQWGNLQQGKYAVGYKTILETDYSRTYGSNPRMVQCYMWYPAETGSGESALYKTYFNDAANDWGTQKDLSDMLGKMLIRDFKSGALNPSFSGELNDSQFRKILQTPIPVKRDASPAPGKFPLILHISSNGALHQSVMLEYLASYGYVVISISMYGSAPAFYGRGEAGAMGLQAMTEDLAFLIQQTRSMSFVDTGKTAVVGMMAQAGISLQMKEELVDGVVCLDCYADGKMLQSLPYYNPRRVRLKILQINNNEFSKMNRYLLDSLIYSERSDVQIDGLQHPDFYPFPRIASSNKAKEQVMHDIILRNTLLFLNYVFAEKGTYQSVSASAKKYEAAKIIPTEAEFLQWLRFGNMDRVREVWKEYGKIISGQENFFSVVLFLSRDKSIHAKEAYEMYASTYPDDPRLKMISQFF